MLLSLGFFIILIAFLVAKLEIQIEGPNGWAAQLPTWRFSNKITSFILSGAYQPLTGYHLYLGLFVLLIFHFPFFVAVPWTPSFELLMLSAFFFFWLAEDFLWFVFNPHYGMARFRPGEIPWHRRWLWRFPFSYYRFFLVALLLYELSTLV